MGAGSGVLYCTAMLTVALNMVSLVLNIVSFLQFRRRNAELEREIQKIQKLRESSSKKKHNTEV